MSFAVSASTTRVVASARAPVKAQRASAAAAFAAPASKTGSAARLSMRSVADTVALRADKSVAARAGSRGSLAVFAGRFETERTYIMIKPDGVQRGYMGEIISRFEKKGMVCKGLKTFMTPREVAEEHYKDLSSKPFFGDLCDYICSGPVVCMVWEGPGVVKSARLMIGATNPLESAPGTIRGDLAVEVGRNVIHGSDSVESAEREIALWFGGDDELLDYEMCVKPWVREE
mmetsp:Transcript_6922/g.28188  ORF Transcript_6922/g.28188 Transcript_6922/m.28188 type:complete len:231 (-) Transcript_6922:94-786(-)